MAFKKLKKFFSNFYNIYLTVLTILISLPILAPILLQLGFTQIAKSIYFVYSFFCHQFAYRSIHFFDYQMAWCSRDTGIWIGIWLTAVLIKFGKLKGIKWYWVIPFVVPIALDGGLQTVFTVLNITPAGGLSGLPLYISTNLTRFITGGIFGIGVSLWLSPMIKFDSDGGSLESKVKEKVSKLPPSQFFRTQIFKVIMLCCAMFPIYVGLVGFWYVTSTINRPLAPIDFVVKAPPEDFLTRREDGICPTDGFKDFLALDCFFDRD